MDALIFDLDGTLVQTEKLKALSYGLAAHDLDANVDEIDVVDAFKDVVGRSRREVATTLLERFGLEEEAAARMDEFGVSAPWQAYVQVRLVYYHAFLQDPRVLQEHRWPHTLALLERSQSLNCKLALATMSRCEQVVNVLRALDIEGSFDFVASRDDVERGKPDPEIYDLVANQLNVRPEYTLVLEDSVSGVQAALAASMHVVALATPFSGRLLHEADLLPAGHVVDDPNELPDVVEHVSMHIPSDSA